MARTPILMNTTEHDQQRRSALITPKEERLLINAYVQPYPRVSTPEQMKNMSAEMQQDKRFCLLCGWTEEFIIMDTRDLGISGRLRMEEREAFSDMIARIADPELQRRVRTIVAANVSRLFRDRWGKEYARFMEICFTYGVKVVIANKTRTGIEHIYDFSKSADVELFRRKCEEAWSYIEDQVGMMHALRNEAGYAGYWVGQSIPTGFTVDSRQLVNGEKNPHYKKYLPYTPWAEKVARLQTRFRELGGILNELFRELETTGFLFPPLDDPFPKELRSKVRLTPVYENPDKPEDKRIIKGYKIASTWGLSSILRNPANIGHTVYKGVIRYNNHPPIVNYMDFLYAFNRLSPTNLDGTPNQDYLERANRYMKRHSSEKPAFLRNHIRPFDEETFTNTTEVVWIESQGHIPYYSFFQRGSGTRQDVYTIAAPDVDRIFLSRFIERLQTPVAEVEFTNFLQQQQAEQKAFETRKRELEVHIAAAKSLRDKLKRRLTLLDDEDDKSTQKTIDEEEAEKELIAEVKRSYRDQKLEISRLEAQYEKFVSTGTEVQKRRTFKKLMRDAGEAWEEVVTQEDIIELIDLFVIKVSLEWVSPQFFTMTIYWKDDEWEIDQAVCFKGGCPAPHWSEEEDAILREYYPKARSKQLMQLLPLRTLSSMKNRAHSMGIRREVLKKDGCVRTFCLRDWEQMQQYGLTEDDLHWKAGSKLVTSWQSIEAGNLECLSSS